MLQVFDLKRFRVEKKLTQTDIATLFNCKQNFISDIERGQKTIPLDKVEILQNRYGDISSYMTTSNEKENLYIGGNNSYNRNSNNINSTILFEKALNEISAQRKLTEQSQRLLEEALKANKEQTYRFLSIIENINKK